MEQPPIIKGCHNKYTVKPKYYDNPKSLRVSDTYRTFSVNCGRCPFCINRRIQDWKFRLAQEENQSKSAYFITLTYDTQTIPISRCGQFTLDNPDWLNPDDIITTKNGNKKLRLDHWQKFIKKLRRYDQIIYDRSTQKIPKPPIKYYMCGEYGEVLARPHMHAIIYNIYDPSMVGKAWQKGKIDLQENPQYGSFAYVAGYLNKKCKIPLSEDDTRKAAFARSSKNLGLNYLTPEIIKWHKSDIIGNNYVKLPNQQQQPLPRYYYDKLYTKQEMEYLIDYWDQEKIWNTELQRRYLLHQDKKTTTFVLQDSNKRAQELKFKNKKKRDQWQNQNPQQEK